MYEKILDRQEGQCGFTSDANGYFLSADHKNVKVDELEWDIGLCKEAVQDTKGR